MSQTSSPRRALALIDDILGEVSDSEDLPADLLSELAVTWLVRFTDLPRGRAEGSAG